MGVIPAHAEASSPLIGTRPAKMMRDDQWRMKGDSRRHIDSRIMAAPDRGEGCLLAASPRDPRERRTARAGRGTIDTIAADLCRSIDVVHVEGRGDQTAQRQLSIPYRRIVAV
jgi:hypothetical protein